jgi:MoxR-like ATPase
VDLATGLARSVLDPMKRAFVGKDEIIDLMGICLVARENLFLLGPPGTAKSALVRELARRIDGRYFDYLLTRFTEPSELFGPFDIRRLRDGDLVTNTEGMLPEAHLVFLDELLNANSAILNSLLTTLNERIFRRGRETRSLPNLLAVAASNHLPEDDALAALFDRFLMRARCDNVPTDRLTEVLAAGWQLDTAEPTSEHTFSVEDVNRLHAQLREADFHAVRQDYVGLIDRMRRAGMPVSDRRAVKLQRLMAASALLCGRKTVHTSDLWILRHIWDTEPQREVLAALVDDVLKKADSPSEGRVHPRARGDDAPDAEALARDLDELAARLADPATSEVDRAALADRVGLLAARAQWVKQADHREALEARVTALLRSLETPS